MLKGKFALLSIAAATLLCWQIASVDTVNSGTVDACESSASGAAGEAFACPQGDGTNLGAAGLTISVTVLDNTAAPVPGIPAADISLVGCNLDLVLCGGSGAIAASLPTDVNGQTTITGDLAAGGCDTGVRVVAQGIVIGTGDCADPCVPVTFKSGDTIGPGAGPPDLVEDGLDFAKFGNQFFDTDPFDPCYDTILVPPSNGNVDAADFALFGNHYNHQCF